MHCRVRYLFDSDLKIRSGQVWSKARRKSQATLCQSAECKNRHSKSKHIDADSNNQFRLEGFANKNTQLTLPWWQLIEYLGRSDAGSYSLKLNCKTKTFLTEPSLSMLEKRKYIYWYLFFSSRSLEKLQLVTAVFPSACKTFFLGCNWIFFGVNKSGSRLYLSTLNGFIIHLRSFSAIVYIAVRIHVMFDYMNPNI